MLFTLVLLVALTVRWFLIPNTGQPDAVDAVVVLAGGRGERLTRAMELVEDPESRVAETLVLSIGNSNWPGSELVGRSCGDDGEVEIVCFEPVPDSTKGEAMAIGRLVEERGWQRVALVTSGYHLHRATLRTERCTDAEIVPVAAPVGPTPSQILHEWLGTIEAQVLDRGCR